MPPTNVDGIAVTSRAPAPARRIGEDDITMLARGCAVLGTGGGGNVESGSLSARRSLREHGDARLVTLADLDASDLILPLHLIGAPTISQEMIPSGLEPARIRDEVERVLDRPIAAIMTGEIGGANGVRGPGWAASLGLPLLDADGMGRAFPEIDMVSMEIANRLPNIVVVADVVGNLTTIRPTDGAWAERLSRAACVASGSSATMTSYTMTASEAAGAVIEGTVTLALKIGAILSSGASALRELCELLNADELVSGKIVELERVDSGGFVKGSVVIEGTGSDKGRLVRLEIQNENLIALEAGRALATVPDMIVALDTETAQAYGTELLQYGQRVTLIAWPCHPLWRSRAGISKTGPRSFGYEIDYVPIEELRDEWRSTAPMKSRREFAPIRVEQGVTGDARGSKTAPHRRRK